MRLLALAIWCAVLTLLPAACAGQPDDYDVYVLDAPDAWVNEAVAEWSTFTSARFTVHEAPGVYDCDQDCVVVKMGTQAEVTAFCPPDAIGCTWCDYGHNSCTVLLLRGMPPDWGPGCTIHEFGHVLGLAHSCDGGSYGGHPCLREATGPAIMNPIVDATSQHVACDDVQQFYGIRGLDPPACTDPRLSAPGALHLSP